MTRRQAECLAFIRSFIERNGYSPCHREIMAALDMKSPSQSYWMVRALERKGKITTRYGLTRSIELVKEAA